MEKIRRDRQLRTGPISRNPVREAGRIELVRTVKVITRDPTEATNLAS